MTEYEIEPVPGLPGHLPPGEAMLWQGSPDWRTLARTAFHTRLVTGYFVLLTGWALGGMLGGGGSALGVALTAVAGAAGVGLLNLLAWGTARTTIYTLTDRRLVLRIGMALPKCINLPLGMIGSVDLDAAKGDVALTPTGDQRLGYLALWPHSQPWKVATPRPMLRALADADTVAAMVARACLAANPGGQLAVAQARPAPAFAEALAA